MHPRTTGLGGAVTGLTGTGVSPNRRPQFMLARPDALYGHGIGSNYQAQNLKLSKHFRG